MDQISKDIKLNRYEDQLEKWKQQFRNEGHDIVQRHGKYPLIEEYLLAVHFFQNLYYVDLRTGEILNNEKQPALLPSMCQMMIFSHLYHLKKNASCVNRMVTYEELKGNHHISNWSLRTTESLSKWIPLFDSDLEKIKQTVIRLGGTIEKNGDFSFSLYVFDDVKFTYIYWRGDEEFSSRLRALYEENVLSFMHQESVIIISDIGIELIAQLCCQ